MGVLNPFISRQGYCKEVTSVVGCLCGFLLVKPFHSTSYPNCCKKMGNPWWDTGNCNVWVY